METINLITFDCDGVLIDSELISAECASAELAQLGMQLSAEDVLKHFLGRSRKEIAAFAKQAGHSVPADFVERLEARIHERFTSQLRPIAGVIEILESIHCHKCVASGSSLSYIRHALELTGQSSFFGQNLFSAAMVRHPKPAPDIFLHAAATLHVKPSQCLVIEDSLTGIAAARAAQMPVVGFIGGSHVTAELVRPTYHDAGCTAVFDSMADLGKYLDELGVMRQQ